MCKYKPATYWQNIAKSFRGGYFFDSHCRFRLTDTGTFATIRHVLNTPKMCLRPETHFGVFRAPSGIMSVGCKQGWQVFAAGWKKTVFFHGKNRPGKNIFCRQKGFFTSKNLPVGFCFNCSFILWLSLNSNVCREMCSFFILLYCGYFLIFQETT